MTIRTQQDGYRWDPPAWCAADCGRRAVKDGRYCFQHAHLESMTAPASGGAGEQAAEAVREREAVSVRRHLQIRWERVHAGMADLILALRREGLDEAADEVTAGMDQIGKAVTRACGREEG